MSVRFLLRVIGVLVFGVLSGCTTLPASIPEFAATAAPRPAPDDADILTV